MARPSGRINTVIFDFGGVITASPFEAFNRLEAAHKLPQNAVRQINSINPDSNAWAQFERAEIDAATFDRLFSDEARAHGIALTGAQVLACLAGDIRPEMVALLDELKALGFTLGCITNNVPIRGNITGGNMMARDDEQAGAIAQIMARFDHIVESAKAGVRKPDPRIYQMCLAALNVLPDQCVYLDDLGINCKPAAKMGMIAIKVISGAQAIAELRTILRF